VERARDDAIAAAKRHRHTLVEYVNCGDDRSCLMDKVVGDLVHHLHALRVGLDAIENHGTLNVVRNLCGVLRTRWNDAKPYGTHEPFINTVRLTEQFLELVDRYTDSSAASEHPTDLIPRQKVVQLFAVSPTTLKRYRDAGRIRSYRPPSAPPNASHLYSKAELDQHFQRRGLL